MRLSKTAADVPLFAAAALINPHDPAALLLFTGRHAPPDVFGIFPLLEPEFPALKIVRCHAVTRKKLRTGGKRSATEPQERNADWPP